MERTGFEPVAYCLQSNRATNCANAPDVHVLMCGARVYASRTTPGKAAAATLTIDVMNNSTAIVYWRPGCPYCDHLLSGLPAEDERIVYRNIWEDPEAAATVRLLQDGNELVPTVVIGEMVLTAPDGAQVMAALA